MSNIQEFVGIIKTSPKSDWFVLLVTFLLTVLFDLVVAIEVGMVMAAALFLKRMSEVTDVASWKYIEEEEDPESLELRAVPSNTLVYEISGPLFFGVADKFVSIHAGDGKNCIILRMRSVPSIDATALRALENLLKRCQKKNVTLLLSHVNQQPMDVMIKAGFDLKIGLENFSDHIDDSLERAKSLIN